MDKIECIMNTCSAVASITGETEISIQEVLRLLNQPIDLMDIRSPTTIEEVVRRVRELGYKVEGDSIMLG